ncbi:unnamed protein product [marine sediment metagenome]|uniref:Uncharacterized protein n=1 Tax=marine sediment metagenome TaxID=412755 RepID=X1U5V2_9ZZZZ
MIESGVGSPSLDQIVALAALAVMTKVAYSLDKAYSPGRSNGNSENPKEQAELLDKFLKLNPEAQRGAIRYIEEMREGYKKKTRA